MKNFWPQRGEPEGFSIEELAKTAREKLAKVSSEKARKALARPSNQYQGAKSHSLHKNSAELFAKKAQSTPHWANRYFDEYREAA